MPYPYKVPDLPYPYEALEPHIDTATMHFHHDKHHLAYVTNLNNALANYPDQQARPLLELLADLNSVPEAIRTAVRNHGGGHVNHTLFWEIMGPNAGGEPSGALADAIAAKFGSFESFKDQFTKAAMGVFGSGWAWLSLDANGELVLSTTPNQDTPISAGLIPLMGVDVWEHAYYLKYQNLRGEYLKAWWNVVNWDAVAVNYTAARVAVGLANVVDRLAAAWERLVAKLA
ncbi:MAG: superoxide dismutase [Anaerolineae bacterium]|nr:superoxide dismutase [Anaerolineae bacterium]